MYSMYSIHNMFSVYSIHSMYSLYSIHSMYSLYSIHSMYSLYSMHNINFVNPPSYLYCYQPISPLSNNRHTRYHFRQYNCILLIRSVLPDDDPGWLKHVAFCCDYKMNSS